MLRLTFLGACGVVTGSKYLLEIDARKILVDCGQFQGSSELSQKNREPFPFDVRTLDALLLTHAHIDHTGLVPLLVKQGYTGPIFCSPPTQALLRYLLPDAGRLQEEEAQYANKTGYSRHKPALPLFDEDDAKRSLEFLKPVAFDETSAAVAGLSFTYHRVGHILGAGFIKVEGGGSSVLFSGDVGRKNVPILKDPEPLAPADYLLLEATYGDRTHGDESPLAGLERVTSETISRRGVLLIPAFAVGRTQEILYYLRELQRTKKIPGDLPIYVDSPMAVSVVETYLDFTSEHDLETRALEDARECPIEGPSVKLMRTVEQSKTINRVSGPAVIISASGMLNGGRILHHLKQRLPDPSTTLLFVGYQAAGTLGRAISDGARTARIHGETVPVRARIEIIPALSAHADENELFEWLSKIPSPPKTTFLVHAEEAARQVFAQKVRSELKFNVALPAEGHEEELG